MTGPIPQTEAVDAATGGLDLLDTPALVDGLVTSQRGAFDAVLAARGAIADVVDEIARRLEGGGTLHYVGAGTSGRLGTLDAAEIPPTFGTDPELVQAHIAGDAPALVRAVEGAEDDAAAGRAAVARIEARDAVVGISASGGAPYVVAAIREARERGAFTVAIVNSEPCPLAEIAERSIALDTGAEPLAGSTRMRAGTAQKVALNTISTAVMIRLGKVYDNLMVDLVATNHKLRMRALRLIMRLTAVDEGRALALLDASRGSVKRAVVMERKNLDADGADRLLAVHHGRLRDALSSRA